MKNDLWRKTLITGADGIIGSYFNFGVKTDRNTLDVANPLSISCLFHRHRPAVIIHLAAQTDMNVCEHNPSSCYQVNSVGVYNIALAAKEIKAKMIYISTDAVFGGIKKTPHREKDTPCPMNHYGRSKYLGELAVQGVLKNYILIRTSWVFGGGPERDGKFVGKIMRQLGEPNNKDIKVVDDTRSSPTYAKDLATVVKKLIAEDRRGVCHVVNSGIATRYDMAKEILRFMGLKRKLLSVKSDFFGTNSGTINTGGLASGSIRLRSWQEALREYLETEWEPLNKK